MESKIIKYKKIFDKVTGSSLIHEAVLLVENTDRSFSFIQEYGNKKIDSLILMASISKLLTTTCILVLYEQGRLSLEDKISKYFDYEILKGLHLINGIEYSMDLTVSDLLFQVSGLPDVYEEGKYSIKNRIISQDYYFTFEEIIKMHKELKPHFSPRTNKRSFYSDINFDILGKIIEKASDLNLTEAFKQYIFNPLNLVSTYLLEKETDIVPNIYYKDSILYRPNFLKSCPASGGCITTPSELMIFIKAFFGGNLFNKEIFVKLSVYNKLQFSMSPINYGGGYMRIPLGRLSTMFIGKGELLGHSGSTGSFAFYYPEKDLYFVGDVNQMSTPSIPIRLTMQLALA